MYAEFDDTCPLSFARNKVESHGGYVPTRRYQSPYLGVSENISFENEHNAWRDHSHIIALLTCMKIVRLHM